VLSQVGHQAALHRLQQTAGQQAESVSLNEGLSQAIQYGRRSTCCVTIQPHYPAASCRTPAQPAASCSG
jgi:hypothetical protein